MNITLTDLQQELAQALREQELAATEGKAAVVAYEKELESWRKENPLYVSSLIATAKVESKSSHVKELRAEAKELLEDEFIDDLPIGFKQTRETILNYSIEALLKAAIQHAPYLLKLDDKAVRSFFTNVAVERPDKTFVIPQHIHTWLPVTIVTQPKASISDKTLKTIKLDTELVKSE